MTEATKLSSTCPFSNHVLISGLSFVRDGGNMMLPGRYPTKLLASFLHEAAHYNCFLFPVGAAITTLYFEAVTKALNCLDPDCGDKEKYDAVDTLVRCRTALQFMRPLAEGVALYSEFDAIPGQARSISKPAKLASLAFTESVADHENYTCGEIAQRLFTHWRLSRFARSRKENLIMQGFGTKNGGYLAGYYFVKNLRHMLIRATKCDLLLDTDFYLNFLMHYFYADLELVRVLLDPMRTIAPWSEADMQNDSINAILVAFQQRAGSIYGLQKTSIEGLDIALTQPRETVPWEELQIGKSGPEANEIMTALNKRINTAVNFSDIGSKLERAVKIAAHDVFHRRNLFCLGTFEEEYRINEHDRLQLGVAAEFDDYEFPIISLGEVSFDGAKSGRCIVDTFLCMHPEYIFSTVSVERETIKYWSMNPVFNGDQGAIWRNICVSSAAIAQSLSYMETLIEAFLDAHADARLLYDHYVSDHDDLIDKIYKNWCGSLMGEFGNEIELENNPGTILRALNGDVNLLRSVVKLSCGGTGYYTLDELNERCQTEGIDYNMIVNHIQSQQDPGVFPLFERIGNVVCPVI